MGLDASVMCNCYRLGKTKPCPFPDYFAVDADGFPTLSLPYDGNEDRFDEFEEWLADCCEHPHMDYQAVYIANWKGYESFLDALEQIGLDHFPVLQAELPRINEGTMSAQSAAAALRELAYFEDAGHAIPKTFLVNSETGEVIGSSNMAQGGKFGWDGRTGLNIGFDDRGFFVQDAWEMNRELFRAMRFEQRLIESESLDKREQFEFIDLDSDRRFTSSTALRVFVQGEDGQLRQEYPHLLHVEQRGIEADYFAYVLDPLKTIFQAAVETGNPVRWS
jgi:hypothetical protein